LTGDERHRDVERALGGVLDPELGENVVELGLVQRILCEADHVQVWLGTTSPACPVAPLMRSEAREALLQLPWVSSAEVHAAENFSWNPLHAAKPKASAEGSGDLLQIIERDVPAAAAEGRVAQRVPLLMIAMVSLAAATWAGRVPMGFVWPIPQPDWVALHGPLMVCGFLGTVIGLERAVGLGKTWALLGPVATALGALGLLLGQSVGFSALLISIGSGYLVCLFASVLRQQLDSGTLTMGLGAVCWLVGNLFWFEGRPVYEVVIWWLAFLVLTIAGERLVLARFRDPGRWKTFGFLICIGLIFAGCLLRVGAEAWAWPLFGLGWVGLGVWLACFDVARRTIRRSGLPRFTAVCLLAGYGWLVFGGLLMLAAPVPPAGPRYDAVLHSFFLGFAISMVFGHAPVIFPSVVGLAIPFRGAFYVHLTLLHLGLATRVVGDLAGSDALRRMGGEINAVSLGLFLLATLSSALAAHAGTARTSKGRHG